MGPAPLVAAASSTAKKIYPCCPRIAARNWLGRAGAFGVPACVVLQFDVHVLYFWSML
jgi:hypothetical protein